ncbi:hypothetical protein KIN20_026429 [Parelaphostrongylus tenuis]|uniref:Uncharacterized protein n=1 Tax=Parelaphostrongylus tenuis TaxID=148309 RepID=A0AAD5QY09_PARTN|nr:hypothetical protein KIN20_026429 [Parelaphostrongylus tenuis]
MGRRIGKARIVASKIFELDDTIAEREPSIIGIRSASINQIQAIARLGLLGKVDRKRSLVMILKLAKSRPIKLGDIS